MNTPAPQRSEQGLIEAPQPSEDPLPSSFNPFPQQFLGGLGWCWVVRGALQS